MGMHIPIILFGIYKNNLKQIHLIIVVVIATTRQ